MVPTAPVLDAHSPDHSEVSSQSMHSALGSAHSIDSNDSNINGPDWWTNPTRLMVAMPINIVMV